MGGSLAQNRGSLPPKSRVRVRGLFSGVGLGISPGFNRLLDWGTEREVPKMARTLCALAHSPLRYDFGSQKPRNFHEAGVEVHAPLPVRIGEQSGELRI